MKILSHSVHGLVTLAILGLAILVVLREKDGIKTRDFTCEVKANALLTESSSVGDSQSGKQKKRKMKRNVRAGYHKEPQ